MDRRTANERLRKVRSVPPPPQALKTSAKNPNTTSGGDFSMLSNGARNPYHEDQNNTPLDSPKSSNNQLKTSGKTKKTSKKKKFFRIVLIILALLAVVTLYFGIRIYNAGGNVFNGGLLNVLTKSEPLQVDKFGRSNILIFGTSEDDEGHSGALLADSIMVLSVNPETKEANTVSIPRDLWVKYSEPCTVGNEGKINAVYFCGIDNGKTEEQASQGLADTVATVIGTDVQYYVKVNYTVVRDAVDALGGIDVVINSSDPRGIYDVNTAISLPNGRSTINGEQALALSRARNSEGGYGLPRSNFDREKNQQLILKAMQTKALSSGVLSNPLKVARLSESLGDNIVTNLPSSQVKPALSIAQNLPSDNIVPIDLASKENPLLTTGAIGGQSVVVPVLGTYNYTAIHATIEQAFQL